MKETTLVDKVCEYMLLLVQNVTASKNLQELKKHINMVCNYLIYIAPTNRSQIVSECIPIARQNDKAVDVLRFASQNSSIKLYSWLTVRD